MGLFYRGWSSFGPFKFSGDGAGVKQVRFTLGRVDWCLWAKDGWGRDSRIDLPGAVDYRNGN
ncbi:hypothetical protein [Pseudofrankia asymbiotica]|uniref:Uncharacterized protein n=1 Tax=Pseudofrankia asymbiotica TaxID=1834516 RepID=A0A1V2I196_9ACTN|nr:hypothetical protein [Pseudofrankia asymbiotica]ONH23538.1 hypothetical protein BL253_32605 [Pseudofrankia asymbiotica]